MSTKTNSRLIHHQQQQSESFRATCYLLDALCRKAICPQAPYEGQYESVKVRSEGVRDSIANIGNRINGGCLTVPVPISRFVDRCIEAYSDLNLSVEGIYTSKIGNEWCYGSGICIRMEDGPLDRRKPDAEQTGLWFTISDGDYSIDCLAHNGLNRFPEGMGNDKLTQVMMTLTESIKDGKYICIEGCYQVVGKEKVFLVRPVTSYDNLSDSQMSESQFDEFKTLCEQHDTSPLELMKLDETLWAELYAPNTLKEAVMLYCLNPQNKQDLLHIGIVTSMGEGKDHLIDHVIAPLVPVGYYSSWLRQYDVLRKSSKTLYRNRGGRWCP